MTLTRAATRRTRRSEAQRQKQSNSQRKKSAVSAIVLTVHAGDMQTTRGPGLGKLEARTRALGPIPGPKDETLKQLVRHYMNNMDTPKTMLTGDGERNELYYRGTDQYSC